MKPASSSCCIFDCVLLAAAYLRYRRYRLLCLLFVWHLFSLWHIHKHTHTWVSVWSVCFDWREACLTLVVQSEARWAGIPEVQVRIPSMEMGTCSFITSPLSFVFLWNPPPPHTHTHTLPTEACAVITDDDVLHRNVLQLLIEDPKAFPPVSLLFVQLTMRVISTRSFGFLTNQSIRHRVSDYQTVITRQSKNVTNPPMSLQSFFPRQKPEPISIFFVPKLQQNFTLLFFFIFHWTETCWNFDYATQSAQRLDGEFFLCFVTSRAEEECWRWKKRTRREESRETRARSCGSSA